MRHARFGDVEPPPELSLAWMCGDHLPESGGVLDQSYQLMIKMRSLQNIHRTTRKYYSLSTDNLNTALSDNERIMLDGLDKMGVLGGIG